jgi:light-regulated signal transduction histidine kinase (bacteriophytochrome)
VFEELYRQRIELHESNERLMSVNKYLDEFTYIVSHDLKAPLRGLTSLCTFLGEELKSNENPEVTELMKLIHGRTSRMQSLIEGILHYSRMAHAKTEVEQVDLNELIINIIDLISLPSNFRIHVDDNLPVLNTDKIRLHEVFQNLLSNAIKHNDKTQGEIRISHKVYPSHFEFVVEDNGRGIKNEYFEKVFGIFQTLEGGDQTQNTGIGLTIVKRIVEQQGGKVWIESSYGSWTRFCFTWNK